MTTPVSGLLTTYGSLTQVELNYFYTASSFGGANLQPTTNYVFIGKADQWPDDNNPPVPTQDQVTIKKVMKNMIAAKLLLSSNLAAVVPRFDWTSGTVYYQYNDFDPNIFALDSNGIMVNQFYVRNSVDQIFKCLSNANGGLSTVQPVLSPGNTNPGQTLYLADGYKWIYITTIDKGLKQKFFDENWMPITIGNNTPNTLVPAQMGTIDAINVTNAGNNYINGLTTTTVTITGDGSGATAYANVSSNVVSDVIVTNTGNNYTFATVTISPATGFTGNNATANAIVSPIAGHGYDPVSDLGCNHIMMSMEYDGSENGIIPTDLSFRQLGIVVTPALVTGNTPFNNVYGTYDTGTVSFGTGNFISGETVYQGLTQNTATYTATCASFDSGNNLVSLINTSGTSAVGTAITGATSGATRVLLSYTPTEWDVGSGYLLYYENRIPVQRTANDNQQLRLVLRF